MTDYADDENDDEETDMHFALKNAAILRAGVALGILLSCAMGLGRPAAAAPRVIQTVFPTEDVVIATQVVEVARDGKSDVAPAIQAAVDATASAGGGVVFLPAGRYRLATPLVLKEGVTLRGDWAPLAQGGAARGTVLMPVAGRGDAEGTPAITLERGSGVREVTIWYPEQSATAPVPYPWTLRTSTSVAGDNYTVQNVTLVNPYQGFKTGPEGNELHTLRNVYATPLKTGVSMDSTTDIGRMTNVTLSPRCWEESGLPGAPATPAEKAALRAFLLREGTAIDVGRSDWEYFSGVQVDGYQIGCRFRKGARGYTNAVMFASTIRDCGTALQLDALNGVGFSATGCHFSGREYAVRAPISFTTVTQFNTCDFASQGASTILLEGKGTLTFQHCTFKAWHESAVDAQAGVLSLVDCDFAAPGTHVRLGEKVRRARLLSNRFQGTPSIANASDGDVQIAHAKLEFARANVAPHKFAPHPRPARTDLFVVTDFGASPTEADNTAAFARALAAARKAGGGTVYAPAGYYRFRGELVVPTGVELRGSFDVPHHTISGGTVLMPTGGRGSENGTPFLQLEKASGVRGLTIWYPEQNLMDAVAYPWAIRSLGPRCWLLDVTLGNAYQGADFWTHPSDGHIIRYLAGGLLKRGLFVSKSNGEGWVEDVQFNPHYTGRLPRDLPRPTYSGPVGQAVVDYQRQYLEGIVFGRCAREYVHGTFLYAAFDGIAFRNDGGGANARVIQHGTDTASRGAMLEATGKEGVEFLNAQLVPLGKWEQGGIIAADTFAGKVAFFNTQMWAGTTSGIIGGKGEVLIQQINTLSGPLTLKGGRCRLENATFDRDLPVPVRVEAGVQGVRLLGNLARDQFRVENAAGSRCYARANSLSQPALPLTGATEFRTGWEQGEPQGFADTVATRGGGQRSVSGGTCRPTDALARTGKRALRLAGNADDPSYSHIYFKVFEQPIAVASETLFSYWLRPMNERGRNVGLDILFSDGSVLRDSPARTVDGGGVHTGGPRGTLGEWTKITIPLGRYHAGKTIAAILFAYDSRRGGGAFEALVDDVEITNPEQGFPPRVTAIPAGGAVAVGTRITLNAPGAHAIRYTLDGTAPGPNSPRYEAPLRLEKPGLWEVRFTAQRADGQLSSRTFGALFEVKAKE